MKTYSAEQIASYLLTLPGAEENDVSNLKLQKLCYYAQGLLTPMRGAPLFSETIEAWDHGPVVPVLYRKYKINGSQPIPPDHGFNVEEVDERDRRALDDVFEYYGQFSAWRLRNMTHEEKPWADAYVSGKDIKIEALVNFFGSQIEEDYVRSVYGKVGQA